MPFFLNVASLTLFKYFLLVLICLVYSIRMISCFKHILFLHNPRINFHHEKSFCLVKYWKTNWPKQETYSLLLCCSKIYLREFSKIPVGSNLRKNKKFFENKIKILNSVKINFKQLLPIFILYSSIFAFKHKIIFQTL